MNVKVGQVWRTQMDVPAFGLTTIDAEVLEIDGENVIYLQNNKIYKEHFKFFKRGAFLLENPENVAVLL